jgi:hypothetical protein
MLGVFSLGVRFGVTNRWGCFLSGSFFWKVFAPSIQHCSIISAIPGIARTFSTTRQIYINPATKIEYSILNMVQ